MKRTRIHSRVKNYSRRNSKVEINSFYDLMYKGIEHATEALMGYLKYYNLNGNTRAYKTGYLSESWDAEVVQKDSKRVSIRVYSDAYYAPYVEYGTIHMKPRPIVRYSVLDLKHKVLPLVLEEMGRISASIIFAKDRGGHVRRGLIKPGMELKWIDHWSGQRGSGPVQRTWSIKTGDL